MSSQTAPRMLVEVHGIRSIVRRSCWIESVLPQSSQYIFGYSDSSSSSGRFETDLQASSAHWDRPALLDRIAECHDRAKDRQTQRNHQRLLEVASIQALEFDSAVLAGVLHLSVSEIEDSLQFLEERHRINCAIRIGQTKLSGKSVALFERAMSRA